MTTKKRADKNAIVVKSHAELADVLGVSVRSVENWAAQGMPGTRGRWSLGKIIRWLRTEGPWSPIGPRGGSNTKAIATLGKKIDALHDVVMRLK